ncbi:hypothetical protein L2744_04330 [Shewanella profunda]|uniref:hypothetical protein n=1 Tax=Shewanella profunda TaxID=254793 RepID=UPI00201082E6|nr:hypothetical protein [Shewanella profunda]MCL1088846.1 hypothetical protein [Shewanella profunda]
MVSFYKDIQLPFAPFEGLSLSVAPKPVCRVSWDIKESRFTCHIEDQEFSFDDVFLDLEFLAAQAKENGWNGSGRILTIPDSNQPEYLEHNACY